jgi:hypothetical protein
MTCAPAAFGVVSSSLPSVEAGSGRRSALEVCSGGLPSAFSAASCKASGRKGVDRSGDLLEPRSLPTTSEKVRRKFGDAGDRGLQTASSAGPGDANDDPGDVNERDDEGRGGGGGVSRLAMNGRTKLSEPNVTSKSCRQSSARQCRDNFTTSECTDTLEQIVFRTVWRTED